MTEKELILKARSAKSAKELMKIASENGIGGIDERAAEEIFKKIGGSGEITDEELSNAAGGINCGQDPEFIKTLPCIRCGAVGNFYCVVDAADYVFLTCRACNESFYYSVPKPDNKKNG